MSRHLYQKIFLALLIISSSPLSSAMEAIKVTQDQLLEYIAAKKSGSNNQSISNINKDVVVIDIRSAKEFNNGHIPGAINISHHDILKNVSLLDQYIDKEIVLYCHSGVRVGYVLSELNQTKTHENTLMSHLSGDFRAWRARGLTIEEN